MFRWLDGVRALLHWKFLRALVRHPLVGSFLILFTIAVMLRDLFLWICMGSAYFDEPE